MKIYIYLILLISSTVFSQEADEVSFNPIDAKKDLVIYREIIETAHSGMYLYTSKEEFNILFANAEKELPKLENNRKFYKLIANIHTKINCGHSSFYPSGIIFSEVENDSVRAFFPFFKVKFLKDILVVAEDYGELKKGTQIVTINGHSVSNITTEVFKLISSDGYNTTFKYRQLEDDFLTNYYLAFGPKESYTIDYISYPKFENKTIILDGISLSELGKNFNEEEANSQPYYLEYFEDKTAILTVNTFSTETKKNQKRFFKFLRNSFKEIEEKGIENLILDIRKNTGGDDGNDMELASYFINKHFKENKFRKLNTIKNMPPQAEYLAPMWYEMLDISKKKKDKIQDIFKKMALKEVERGSDGAYYWKEDKIIHRDPAKYRFKGNVYVLTSGKVFSGGALFSALVRDKSNAIFIGEETGGGYYRHTGSIPLFYQLPNSGFFFSLFTVIGEQDVDQKLFPEGSGTQPHYEVYQTITEFVNGKDAVLEKAKKLINDK
ncbi:MAG: hypothetical protein HN704_09725 [Bacteroidetes bacterium]|nr:hypothetical protein [Bacteroidota bacterium]MBT7144155.1 hypothetical protein [Bacteroidota bacterium]MBT7491874.1 hypothetical protein [Bacteroidota bacterium]